MASVRMGLLVLGFVFLSTNILAGDGCGFQYSNECTSTPTDGCNVWRSTTFQPGTYVLPHGIDFCNGVTLDCNGAVLTSGVNDSSSVGISIAITKMNIKNCVVENYYTGIRGGSAPVIESNFTSNTVRFNRENGFFFSSPLTRVTFENNVLNFNGQNGLYHSSGYLITLLNNTADYNGQNGFYSFSSASVMFGNTANYNGQNGFISSGSSTMSDNTASYNGLQGFYIFGNYLNFENNTANYNSVYGFFFPFASNSFFTLNKANSNNQTGMVFSSSSSNNVFSLNDVQSNGGYGISFGQNSNNNLLMQNNINNNSLEGVSFVSSNSTRLVSNTICFNYPTDFKSINSFNNTGDENTCENPGYWNDDGIQGCTYYCTNKPPSLVTPLPDLSLNRNSGLNNNSIYLPDYFIDRETLSQDLFYSLVYQTNRQLVDCVIDSGLYLDCTVAPNKNGVSNLQISASDGEHETSDDFTVNIVPKHAPMQYPR